MRTLLFCQLLWSFFFFFFLERVWNQYRIEGTIVVPIVPWPWAKCVFVQGQCSGHINAADNLWPERQRRLSHTDKHWTEATVHPVSISMSLSGATGEGQSPPDLGPQSAWRQYRMLWSLIRCSPSLIWMWERASVGARGTDSKKNQQPLLLFFLLYYLVLTSSSFSIR